MLKFRTCSSRPGIATNCQHDAINASVPQGHIRPRLLVTPVGFPDKGNFRKCQSGQRRGVRDFGEFEDLKLPVSTPFNSVPLRAPALSEAG